MNRPPLAYENQEFLQRTGRPRAAHRYRNIWSRWAHFRRMSEIRDTVVFLRFGAHP